MSNRLDKALHDARGNLRVKENKPISWRGKDGQGQGKVRNISLTGMLLETDTMIETGENRIFSFKSSSSENGYIPETGRIVWQRKKKFSNKKHFCGVRFLEPDESTLNGLRDKIQDGIKQFTTRRKWKVLLNIVFIIGITGLTAYSLWISMEVYQGMNTSTQRMVHVASDQASLTRNYGQLQKETAKKLGDVTEELTLVQQELHKTQQLYKEGQGMLQGVSKDLETAKIALAQTEQMLTQAKAGNKTMKGDMQALKEFYGKEMREMKAEMNNTIVLLQEKNVKLITEMGTLQEQLDYYGGDVKDITDSRAANAASCKGFEGIGG